ncbi:MAG: redoxin domain-containing protein [Aristaeellaceae bacterium]
MKNIMSVVAMLLALVLCMGTLAVAEEAPYAYELGGRIEDFTVTTYDGRTVTLSEVLKEKEAVLINIWATWCGPCRNEFPFMEEAYEQYADRVEIIALSCEETDTDDVLAEFAASLGLTFNIARDTVDLSGKFWVEAIPTSIMIDRFGTICFLEAGSMPDAGSFTRLFDAFLGDGYTESVLLTEVPPMKPNVAASPEADVAAALEAASVLNPTEEYVWPMVVTEKDGRTVVASTNAACSATCAEVTAVVSAKAGDAIVVTFKTSTEAAFDLLKISFKGEVVKSFGGEHDWMTYAIPVDEDGEYLVALSYAKDQMEDGGEDTVWIDSVAAVSGEEAAAALSANPVYPVAEETALTIVNEGAKEIVISDESGLLMSAFGSAVYYIVNEDVATVSVALSADVDPEEASFYSDYNGQTTPLNALITDAGYTVTSGIDTLETTGYDYSCLMLLLDSYGENSIVAICFRDEENANSFVFGNELGTWMYADGTLPASSQTPAEAVEVVTAADYTVRYVDQDGNPVAGVMLQVCDDQTCQVYTSDENGVCAFTLAPYAWELHTLKVPAGYEGDTETITVAPAEGGELVFTLNRL